MVAGPELARLVKEYEASSELKSKVDVRHHEETPSAQSKFVEQVQSLTSVISETGNPFLEESSDLLVLDTKDIVDPGIAKKLKEFRETGEQQFSSFWNKLYNNDTKFFHDTIHRNNFTFFSILHEKEGPGNRVKLDRNLFSRLFIASQTRAVDLDEFENSPFPASLSENGNVYFTQKSDLVEQLEKHVNVEIQQPAADTLIIDGTALAHTLKPKLNDTFVQYAQTTKQKLKLSADLTNEQM